MMFLRVCHHSQRSVYIIARTDVYGTRISMCMKRKYLHLCSNRWTFYHVTPGASPVTVDHSCPEGTSHSPLQAQFQSAFLIISFCAATKVGTEHIPSASAGHPSIPVRGATASLMTIRICSSSRPSHDRTSIINVLAPLNSIKTGFLTLELDVSCEGCKLRDLKGVVLGDVISR